jgi:hypothetical protein
VTCTEKDKSGSERSTNVLARRTDSEMDASSRPCISGQVPTKPLIHKRKSHRNNNANFNKARDEPQSGVCTSSRPAGSCSANLLECHGDIPLRLHTALAGHPVPSTQPLAHILQVLRQAGGAPWRTNVAFKFAILSLLIKTRSPGHYHTRRRARAAAQAGG